jgi:hypothetical protein
LAVDLPQHPDKDRSEDEIVLAGPRLEVHPEGLAWGELLSSNWRVRGADSG